jgi:hypothetical protein
VNLLDLKVSNLKTTLPLLMKTTMVIGENIKQTIQIFLSTLIANQGFHRPRGKTLVSPLDYFMLFFSDKISKEILNETNGFSKDKIMQHRPLQKRSIWVNWMDDTMEELTAFLGFILYMGMDVKSDLKDYFSVDWLDRQPFFKDVFSRDKFFRYSGCCM